MGDIEYTSRDIEIQEIGGIAPVVGATQLTAETPITPEEDCPPVKSAGASSEQTAPKCAATVPSDTRPAVGIRWPCADPCTWLFGKDFTTGDNLVPNGT